MKDIYEKAKQWYTGLPWYWKIAGGAVVILLGFLYVLAKIYGGSSDDTATIRALDERQANQTSAELQDLKQQDEEITRRIDVKKQEIATKINQAGVIDQTALDRREEINQATSMAELDAIQKRYGL